MFKITQHFGKPTIYRFGPIHNGNLHTPFKKIPVQCSVRTPFKYPIQDNSLFFVSTIFNSYVISVEETFTSLYSADKKLTIIKEKIQEDMLYVFKIVNENSNVRVVELYKFDDPKFVGFKTNGRVRCMKKQIKFSVNGTMNDLMPMREYFDGEEIEAVLIENDGTKNLYRPTKIDTKFFDAKIYKENDKLFFLKNDYNYGILEKKEMNREAKIGDLLKVRILRENNFKFIFTMHEGSMQTVNEILSLEKKEETLYEINKESKGVTNKNNFDNPENFIFTEGSVQEATIRNIHPVHGTFVCINGFIGIMKKSETSKNYVVDIQMHLCGKSTIKGVLYNVDKENRSFMFSSRKYEEMIEKDLVDLEPKSDSKTSEHNSLIDENEIICDEHILNPNKKIKIETTKINMRFEDIYNQNLFKKWEKNDFIQKNITDFREYLESNILTDISILKIYIEVLLYLDLDVYSCLKKIIKTESQFSFIVNKTLNILPIETLQNILRLYQTKFNTVESFQAYLSFLIKNKLNDSEIYTNMKYQKEAVVLFYKLTPKEARSRVELIVDKNNNVWEAYIEHEKSDIDYCRNLFRRVTSIKWKIDEAKEWFKKWLEFEKDNEGDCDEVKEKAKLFVKNIKSN